MKRIIITTLLLLPVVSDASCRSATQKHHFDVQQGYPYGRKGYVVDHICPLEQGGVDAPINMQYQTIAEGKAKDHGRGAVGELTPEGRKLYCNATNSTPTRQVFNCKGHNGGDQ
ncbi:HNH endonuclease signature motif containing protein [Methylovulum miyakonense]|uniref:HNH endonuclease signature motif containing protein n=1 Tax=Methylovulum miyakonense TaxID=645578 RepID=UPI00037A3130|nr:HNH endonuclease signature motif containing protein [Methylovulum miyakonense]